MICSSGLSPAARLSKCDFQAAHRRRCPSAHQGPTPAACILVETRPSSARKPRQGLRTTFSRYSFSERSQLPGGCGSVHTMESSGPRRRGDRLTSRAIPGIPLAPSADPWIVWSALACAGAAGLWSEKTKIGRGLSGALVATLLGLLISNLGLIPCDAPQYAVVNKMLLPLAIPMLLYAADLRRVFFDTGKLLGIFVVGSVSTVLATVAAFKILPLASLGTDGWKVASALCARHIGGAVNYVGVVETLGVSPTSQAAGLAADNLICAVYFSTIYWLARSIPADTAEQEADGKQSSAEAPSGRGITVLEGATALAVSAVLCALGTSIARAYGSTGLSIPIITLLAVALATAVPRLLAPLVASGEGLAAIIMQVFFATVGANGSISSVLSQAPSLFVFALLQVSIHLVLVIAGGRLLGYSLRDTLVASNANVGGPTTAAGMAAAKGWRSSIVPALLVGTFGYAIATFVSIALGFNVLKPMA